MAELHRNKLRNAGYRLLCSAERADTALECCFGASYFPGEAYSHLIRPLDSPLGEGGILLPLVSTNLIPNCSAMPK
jgi:hypothetical protein